ncbi:anti-sigma factor [Catenuloplanes japonicus]|uniref:hypothetical protein n=1 Tax=Catenuloplanes japonicus TaxID=33876 RepID=UPI0005244F9E|nr:hypothetical protein [Catenuloplanes japonicus]
MTVATCADGRMRTLVGFLALDRVSDAERETVAAHLEACDACRVERDEVERIVAILARLSPADVRELVAEFGTGPGGAPGHVTTPGDQLFGAPGAPRPALVATPPRSVPGPEKTVPAPAKPVVPAPAPVAVIPQPKVAVGEGYLPPRPATGPLARGPHSHRRARRKRLRIAVGLSGALVVALGTVFAIRPWDTADGLGPVIAVADSGDDLSGVQMNAIIYDDGGQAGVHLTAGGLDPAVDYQLFAVTGDGEDLLLGRLTGAPGGGTYTGEIALPVDDLWSFSVRKVDGTIMISADVVMGSPSPGEGAPK